MDLVTQQFHYFFNDLSQNGIGVDQIHEMCLNHLRDPKAKTDLQNLIQIKAATSISENSNLKETPAKPRSVCNVWILVSSIVVALLACGFGYLLVLDQHDISGFFHELKRSPCLLEHNEISSEFTRPLFNCSICEGFRTVPVETNLSRRRFEKLYGYTSLPVLMKGSSKAWAARKVFSFDFLKNLYEENSGSLDMVEEQCQFFGYNTNFKTLAEMFNMSKEMSELKLQKWYVGWSNCVPSIEAELRKHYQKPDFLPEDSVSSHLDWIFMGGWGYGAPIHLDNVERPSWQAQLSGKKTWMLIPPPECESVCHNLQVTMSTGDIIVVDTNQWFHSTYIHPGEISITIGSEYD